MFEKFKIDKYGLLCGWYVYSVTIHDSNFIEIVKIYHEISLNDEEIIVAAIISIYSKKQLNVAVNLLIFLKKDNGPVLEKIKRHMVYINGLSKYIDDIKKYLILT